MNQYWSLIGAVLVRNIYQTGLSSDQYWSTQRPVLVEKPTL